jgi:multiple sugar transport system substrate-binding protein
VAAVIAAVLVVALGGSLLMQVTKSPPSGLPSGSARTTPNLTPAATASASVPKTTVVWYVGLGAGSQSDQEHAEEDFVNNYNATNKDNVNLQLELLHGYNATDTWRTSFDSGKGPDVIGPVGIQVRAEYPSYWLGLNDEIARNKTDLSVYPPALLKTFKNAAGQYEGLPYDEYPAFIFYNKDLFKDAGSRICRPKSARST